MTTHLVSMEIQEVGGKLISISRKTSLRVREVIGCQARRSWMWALVFPDLVAWEPFSSADPPHGASPQTTPGPQAGG